MPTYVLVRSPARVQDPSRRTPYHRRVRLFCHMHCGRPLGHNNLLYNTVIAPDPRLLALDGVTVMMIHHRHLAAGRHERVPVRSGIAGFSIH
jgi:hypothetical protein